MRRLFPYAGRSAAALLSLCLFAASAHAISSAVNIPVIASGGAGKLEHFYDAIDAGASAVLAASVFHFNTFSVPQVKDYLRGRGVAVRR